MTSKKGYTVLYCTITVPYCCTVHKISNGRGRYGPLHLSAVGFNYQRRQSSFPLNYTYPRRCISPLISSGLPFSHNLLTKQFSLKRRLGALFYKNRAKAGMAFRQRGFYRGIHCARPRAFSGLGSFCWGRPTSRPGICAIPLYLLYCIRTSYIKTEIWASASG